MRTSRFGIPSRLYRAALLIAGLLHLVSIPAEAVLHGWTHVHPQETGWTAQQTDRADPPHHHDLVCAICHVVSRALHEPGSARVFLDLAHATPSAPAASLPAPVPLARAHARAPPV
jgi:hypothetical protein